MQLLLFESFGGFGKGVGEILWKAANVLQNKLTRRSRLGGSRGVAVLVPVTSMVSTRTSLCISALSACALGLLWLYTSREDEQAATLTVTWGRGAAAVVVLGEWDGWKKVPLSLFVT